MKRLHLIVLIGVLIVFEGVVGLDAVDRASFIHDVTIKLKQFLTHLPECQAMPSGCRKACSDLEAYFDIQDKDPVCSFRFLAPSLDFAERLVHRKDFCYYSCDEGFMEQATRMMDVCFEVGSSALEDSRPLFHAEKFQLYRIYEGLRSASLLSCHYEDQIDILYPFDLFGFGSQFWVALASIFAIFMSIRYGLSQ